MLVAFWGIKTIHGFATSAVKIWGGKSRNGADFAGVRLSPTWMPRLLGVTGTKECWSARWAFLVELFLAALAPGYRLSVEPGLVEGYGV